MAIGVWLLEWSLGCGHWGVVIGVWSLGCGHWGVVIRDDRYDYHTHHQ